MMIFTPIRIVLLIKDNPNLKEHTHSDDTKVIVLNLDKEFLINRKTNDFNEEIIIDVNEFCKYPVTAIFDDLEYTAKSRMLLNIINHKELRDPDTRDGVVQNILNVFFCTKNIKYKYKFDLV